MGKPPMIVVVQLRRNIISKRIGCKVKQPTVYRVWQIAKRIKTNWTTFNNGSFK